MHLFPKDYVAPVKVEKVPSSAKETEIKNAIKAFATVPRHYEEIKTMIENTVGVYGVNNLKELIDAVRDEWHPVAKEVKDA